MGNTNTVGAAIRRPQGFPLRGRLTHAACDFTHGNALLAPLVKGERANEVGEGIPQLC